MNPIERLVRLAPPLLAVRFTPDCCIVATKVACGVLNHFGIPAWPQPTRLIVQNMKAWKRYRRGDHGPPLFRQGEFTLGIGFGQDIRKRDPQFKGYDGHLVARVGDVIVDLSLGQAARPEKGVHLPKAAMIPGKSIVMNGCVLEYGFFEDSSFEVTPDWTDTARSQPIIESLVEQIGGSR